MAYSVEYLMELLICLCIHVCHTVEIVYLINQQSSIYIYKKKSRWWINTYSSNNVMYCSFVPIQLSIKCQY